LPARFRPGFPWALDKRCETAREVAADLLTLWQDLGGAEALSAQQRWLCERVVYLRRRCVEYEADMMAGRPPSMDAGTYSNFANVLMGYLKALGLHRQARPARSLRDYMAGKSAEAAA
jgi:hypothetical protein